MPHPFPLATVFTGGMRRDVDRTEIPGGSAYNMVDFIPDEVQAVTAGRGGWTYAGPALSGATQIQSLSYFNNGTVANVFAVDSAGKMWDAIAGTSPGSPGTSPGPPFFHRGRLIFPQLALGVSCNSYDGSTFSLLGGPHNCHVGCVYKDHSVLSKQGGYPANRVFFSAPGDPTTWDLSFGWWDTTGVVTALASTLNSLLIFHNDSTERLRGTTPPPGSDMTLEPFLPNVGCLDPWSIASWQQKVIFCGSQGIYMTDGASVVDLTANAQMKTYWQSLMAGYSSSWRIAGGVYRDHYIVSINNGNTLVDCLCVNMNDRTMWRFSNLHGSSFVNLANATQEKLYMGQLNTGRVAELSSLWSPSASVKQDGDGNSPTPIVETGMFRGFDRLHRRWIESMGKQKWRYSYVDYDLRDSAADNPTATLSYCTSPTGSYTQAGLTLPETTDISRVRRSLNPTQGGATRSQMLGLKYAVTGPYATANLLTLEGVFEPIDIGQL